MNLNSNNTKLIGVFLVGVLTGLIVATALFLAFNQKEPVDNPGSQDVDQIINYRWYLRVADGSEEALGAYIVFTAEGQASGFGGCNQFGADYSTTQAKMKIENVFSTKMYCQDTAAAEAEFLGNLTAVESFEVNNKTLLLKTGSTTLTFNRYENQTSEVVGKWELVRFVEGTKQIAKVKDKEVSLSFNDVGEIAGTACNSFGGSYYINQETGSLSFDNLVSTDMYCEPAAFSEQEGKLFQSLSAAKQYEIKGTTLKIYYAEDQYIELERVE